MEALPDNFKCLLVVVRIVVVQEQTPVDHIRVIALAILAVSPSPVALHIGLHSCPVIASSHQGKHKHEVELLRETQQLGLVPEFVALQAAEVAGEAGNYL